MTRDEGRVFDGDDVSSMLMQAVYETVASVVGLGTGVALGLLRRPLLVLLGGVTAGVVWRFGAVPATVALAALLAGLAVAQVVDHERTFRLVGRHVSAFGRGLTYPGKWATLCRRVGLVAQQSRGSDDGEVPALVRVRVTRAGVERLLLRLPVGLSAGQVGEHLDAIAAGFRVKHARLAAHRPGFVWVEMVRRDPLDKVVRPAGKADPLLASVPVGRAEDGSAWTIRIRGTHLLVAGATGSGKGSVLWSAVLGLRDHVRSGTVEIWAVDPKGGMELGPAANVFRRFEGGNPEAMCTLLEELVALKDGRAASLAVTGSRLHTPTVGSPHIVAIIDELATLTAFAERSVVRRIEQSLGLLLTQGRACGITVVAAVQDPGKDVVAYRDLFPTRIALRLDTPIQVEMVLGEGAVDLGARADQISELTPGVGFVRVEGTRGIRRVRASYVDDASLAALNADFQRTAIDHGTDDPARDGGAAA